MGVLGRNPHKGVPNGLRLEPSIAQPLLAQSIPQYIIYVDLGVSLGLGSRSHERVLRFEMVYFLVFFDDGCDVSHLPIEVHVAVVYQFGVCIPVAGILRF